MGLKDLKKKLIKPCDKCPYKLGIVSMLVNPCPQCKDNGYKTYERLISQKNNDEM